MSQIKHQEFVDPNDLEHAQKKGYVGSIPPEQHLADSVTQRAQHAIREGQ